MVVTIVVLLILAGVSISLIVDNNGIIKRSKDAREQYGQARENEQADLDNVSEWINKQAGIKSEVDWNKILEDANSNPDNYKHPDQSSTNKDIGIGTDGKPVNMDLWTYRIADGNRKEIILNSITGSGPNIGGYQNSNVVNGKIIGMVPQYIKIEAKSEFYTVTDMSNTFSFCWNLTVAPEIPSTVNNLPWAFSYTGINDAPRIPLGVTDMGYTFFDCTSLTTAPEIPSSVTNMEGTFSSCKSLTGNLVINANPTYYDWCLSGASTAAGTNLVVSGTSTLLDEIIATKSENSNITKGN